MLQDDVVGESFPLTGRWSLFSAGLSTHLLAWLSESLSGSDDGAYRVLSGEMRKRRWATDSRDLCVLRGGMGTGDCSCVSSLDSRQAYVPSEEYRRADEGSTARHQISSFGGTAAFSLFPYHGVNVFAAYFTRARANGLGRLCLILVLCPLGRVEHTRDT